MPRVFALLLMILLLLVASCAGPEEVEVLPTAVAELPTTAATLALPTSTSTAVPTATATEVPTELPTQTPTLRPTATPRPTDLPPTATATAVYVPPTGSLYFLLSNANEIITLYKAQFSAPNEWELQPVLENLVGTGSFAFSPNYQQISYKAIEDTNQDGHASSQSHRMGFDRVRLHLYDLASQSDTLLPWSGSVFEFYWMNMETILVRMPRPDNNRLYQPYYAPTNGGEAYEPFSTFTEISTQWINLSPNRQYLVATLSEPESNSTPIHTIIFDVHQQVNKLTLPPIQSAFFLRWSPDGQFLLIPPLSLLIDLQTWEQITLDIPFFMAYANWDAGSQNIFFLYSNEQEQTALAKMSLNTMTWETLTAVNGVPAEYPYLTPFELTRELSPDGNYFVFATQEDEQALIHVWNIPQRSLQTLPLQTMDTTLNLKSQVIGWEPNSEWFLHVEWDWTPSSLSINWWLYLTHVSTSQSHLILQGENNPYPYAIQWLP